jgi:hypothetical protein
MESGGGTLVPPFDARTHFSGSKRTMSSIDELKARIIQLCDEVPIQLLNDAVNQTMDTMDELKVRIAGTNNDVLVQALANMEAGNSKAVDGAVEIVEARDLLWAEAERM